MAKTAIETGWKPPLIERECQSMVKKYAAEYRMAVGEALAILIKQAYGSWNGKGKR